MRYYECDRCGSLASTEGVVTMCTLPANYPCTSGICRGIYMEIDETMYLLKLKEMKK